MPWIKNSLGISIEEDLLHLACLRSTWRGPRLIDAASFPFPASAAEGEALAPDIQKFFLRCGVGALDEITFGIPRSALFFRHLSTPAVKEKDLPDLLRYEYDRHLPGKREDFVVGHAALGSGEDGGRRRLLGAAGRAKLDEFLNLLSSANINPHSLQPAPMALAAAFRHAGHQSAAALLISSDKDFFNADYVEEGRVVLSRRFRHRPPSGEDGEAGDPSDPLGLATALGERLHQKLYLDDLPGGALPPLWLYGFGEEGGAVAELLEARVDAPVRIFSPLRDLQAGGGASGVAFGLALLGLAGGKGGLELSEERAEALREGPDFRSTAVLAAVLLVTVLGFYGFRALENGRYLGRLDREVEPLRVRKENVEALSRRVQKKRQRLDYLASTVGERVRQADLLKELTVLIPEDTHLTDYSFKSGGLEISGLSPSASRLLSILEESSFFEGARFSSAIVSQGKTHERFKIHLDLQDGDG